MLNRFPEMDSAVTKILNDMKNLNLREIREQIQQLFKMIERMSSEETVKGLANDLAQLQELVNKHTFELKELRSLLHEAKPNVGGSGGPSSNEMLLLRNRVEYLEQQVANLRKALAEF